MTNSSHEAVSILADDDEAIILASRIRVVNFSHSSCVPGDLVARIQNRAQTLYFEFLDRGVKSLIRIPFADIEISLLDVDRSEDSARDFSRQCIGCGERFGTEDHLKSHAGTCYHYMRDSVAKANRKRERDASGVVGVHFSLRRSPSFWKECDFDPSLPMAWAPCDDFCGGELSSSCQVSVYLREREDGDKMSGIFEHTSSIQRSLLRKLEDRSEGALVGRSVMKLFPGHGHFRGVIQSFDGNFFTVLYADGDSEDLESDEVSDLLASTLPHGPSQRRRRQRATNVYPRGSSRVGSEYQATIPPPSPSAEDLEIAHLMQQVWDPTGDSGLLEAQIKQLKCRYGCQDVGEKPSTQGKLAQAEESVLMALWEKGHDLNAATVKLDEIAAAEEARRPWSQEEVSEFSVLMMKHAKDFKAVRRELSSERSMSEILHFYYSSWKQTRQYVALKSHKSEREIGTA
eukprot:CAMPEP_0172636068 /NCGR_PEP_ID=MMETSP1068-20121228/202253_1 /TAXON_ID=35684 /ORGANISM="Pseudopedinella elastica, Strain CCMP716" /LENGTH=458 /DNA_ID=CAMNT_0013448427 /DNA_START=90 /DNA_END=1466 /DNA_ORIENTATION=-